MIPTSVSEGSTRPISHINLLIITLHDESSCNSNPQLSTTTGAAFTWRGLRMNISLFIGLAVSGGMMTKSALVFPPLPENRARRENYHATFCGGARPKLYYVVCFSSRGDSERPPAAAAET